MVTETGGNWRFVGVDIIKIHCVYNGILKE